MKNYVCPDCGKKFNEGIVPDVCPNCGCPKDSFKEVSAADTRANVSPALESSNDFEAEHTANGLAVLSKVIGIILGITGLIAGFMLISESGMEIFGILSIVVGLVLFLVFLVMWAFIKLLVNISYRLTRLDNKYNPK